MATKQNSHNIKTAADLMPKTDSARKILLARATHFSQPPLKETPKIEMQSYIKVQLGNEYYGIPYSDTKEVINHDSVTPIPNIPNYIAGVINHRGALITVIDLKRLFQLSDGSKEKSNLSSIIIIADQTGPVGLLVDTILGNEIYDPKQLENPLPTDNRIKLQYIAGINNGFIAVINMPLILEDLHKQLAIH